MRNFCCFRCINKSYPENGIALHRVPFFFNKCARRRKNMDRFCTATTNSLFDFLKYWRHVHDNWQLPVKHRYLLMQQSLYSLSIKASCQALRGENEQQGLVWISLPCKSAPLRSACLHHIHYNNTAQEAYYPVASLFCCQNLGFFASGCGTRLGQGNWPGFSQMQ